jgi:hypothetical protein
MTLRAEFTLRHSDLEGFLSEPIWEEKNGSMLSILSAFARLGIDPWQEAARLAAMPREAAAAALAKLLTSLPWPSPEQPDHGEIARNLVQVLPKPIAQRAAEAKGRPKITPAWSILEVILMVALAGVLILLQVSGQLF